MRQAWEEHSEPVADDSRAQVMRSKARRISSFKKRRIAFYRGRRTALGA